MTEPTLVQCIKDTHSSGWYTTFAYKHGGATERSESGLALMKLFLRHILTEAAQAHVCRELRTRCAPILAQAHERGCVYFRGITRNDAIVMTFNNGIDMQYTRTLRYSRLCNQYSVLPDRFQFICSVQSFILNQPGIEPMLRGVPRHLSQLAAARGQTMNPAPETAMIRSPELIALRAHERM